MLKLDTPKKFLSVRWWHPRGGSFICGTFGGKFTPFRATFWKHLQRCVLYNGYVYKLGCEAVIKVRGDDHLEGAHSLCHFWREISSFLCHFLETLTETGSIHWVGVQTWLQSTHEGKRWWPPRGGSFIVSLFEGNLLLFVPLCQVHCVNGNKVNTF